MNMSGNTTSFVTVTDEEAHDIKFSCLLFNIRSLRANFREFLARLESEHLIPDIIVLTETWIYSHEEEHFSNQIYGYNSFFFSRDDYPSGGVAIYIRARYNSVLINSQSDNVDTCSVAVKLAGRDIHIVGAYRSPSPARSNITQFIDHSLSSILGTTSADALWLADANIDLAKSTEEVDNYADKMGQLGFLWCETSATRPRSDTIIDHIFPVS